MSTFFYFFKNRCRKCPYCCFLCDRKGKKGEEHLLHIPERSPTSSGYKNGLLFLFSMRGPCIPLYFLAFVALSSLLTSVAKGEIPPRPPPSTAVAPSPSDNQDANAYPEVSKTHLPVFTMDYPRIQIPFEITLWVLLASFAKIGEQTFNTKIQL